MENWIGPAIVAAVIAALVSVAGWFVTMRQTLALERSRRREKTRDFQIALRAEIQSELADLEAYDIENGFERIRSRYDADPTYSVFVPKPARHLIFDALVAELYILPEGVIDPVVLYMRQREVVVGLCDDIRSPEFRSLAKQRQLELYRDYLDKASPSGIGTTSHCRVEPFAVVMRRSIAGARSCRSVDRSHRRRRLRLPLGPPEQNSLPERHGFTFSIDRNLSPEPVKIKSAPCLS